MEKCQISERVKCQKLERLQCQISERLHQGLSLRSPFGAAAVTSGIHGVLELTGALTGVVDLMGEIPVAFVLTGALVGVVDVIDGTCGVGKGLRLDVVGSRLPCLGIIDHTIDNPGALLWKVAAEAAGAPRYDEHVRLAVVLPDKAKTAIVCQHRTRKPSTIVL